jgi:hypothetical protein
MAEMTERERQVRERAEKLWQEAGRPEGRDEEFWHQAEAEIAAENNQPPLPSSLRRTT